MTPTSKAPASPLHIDTAGAVKWLLGIFAAVLLLLVTRAFLFADSVDQTHVIYNQAILRLQISDSINTARMVRIENKVDVLLDIAKVAR